MCQKQWDTTAIRIITIIRKNTFLLYNKMIKNSIGWFIIHKKFCYKSQKKRRQIFEQIYKNRFLSKATDCPPHVYSIHFLLLNSHSTLCKCFGFQFYTWLNVFNSKPRSQFRRQWPGCNYLNQGSVHALRYLITSKLIEATKLNGYDYAVDLIYR